LQTFPKNTKIDRIITRLLNEGGVQPTDQIVWRLKEYFETLHFWNQRVNLSGIKSIDELILKHLGDTLTLLPFIPPRTIHCLDLGTGAGVPGLILKILRPELEMYLVDAVRKKVSFLKTIIARLGLRGIYPLHARITKARGVPEGPETGFDLIVSQAVTSIETFSEIARPLLSSDGMVISMKGINVQEEIKGTRQTLQEKGWEVEIRQTTTPLTNWKRYLIILKV